MEKTEILNLETRRQIFNYIRDNPGLHLHELKEFEIRNLAYQIRDDTSVVFVDMVMTYHESLKFLRHYWYEYESNIEGDD